METGKQTLLAALAAEGVEVVRSTANQVEIQHNFRIEIAEGGLYKLLDGGRLIAPFSSAKELAGFVRMDLIQRNLL